MVSAISRSSSAIRPRAASARASCTRVEAMRTRYPYFEIRDGLPEIDRLPMIKTPREIEILRHNGAITAEGG
jgi:Xaa-Pro aminopeptidase